MGKERIPEEGPLIVASNHPGAYDSIAIISNLPRQDLKVIVSDVPFLRSLPAVSQRLIFTPSGPYSRMAALRGLLRHVQEGGAALIFPSGLVDPDPAFMPEAGPRGWRRGGRVGRPARGDHEVIVNSPDHELSLGDMGAEAAALLVDAWLRRYRHFASRDEVRQVQIIINHKREAGASLDHPHTQVFVLPMVTRTIADELREFRRAGDRGCPLCRAVEEAHEDGRVVAENGGWTALVPYAARAPFEMRFVPRRHGSDFGSIGEDGLTAMADILARSLKSLSDLLGNPAYNLWVHTAPCDGKDHGYYHWHVEMVPRIIVSAGFEMATGMHLNILAPGEAARQLRETL